MNRAIFFVDGNNWYHSLKDCGLTDLQRLNYPHIFDKLAGPARRWTEARYYIPDVGIMGSAALLNEQREFLKTLKSLDARITVQMGRLESRVVDSEAAIELLRYLGGLKTRLDIHRDRERAHPPLQEMVRRLLSGYRAHDLAD